MRCTQMIAVALVVSAWLAGAATAEVCYAEQPPVFSGPFELRQALYLHIVNPSGEGFTIRMRWRDPMRAQRERPLLFRVFDPEERVLIRHEAPGPRGNQIEDSLELAVPARGSGVYQVCVTGFEASIDFTTTPALSFGVFGYPNLACRDDQYADARVYLPPGLDVVTVRSGEAMQSVEVLDDAGASRLKNAGQMQSQVALPTGGEHIWRFSAKATGVGTLNFGGMPIILCPDEASARAIRASVDVLADGTVCFHKFQVRAHALLAKYRRLPPEALRVQPPVLIRQKTPWLDDPQRNQLLLGPYGVFAALDTVLAEQNVDGSSPWFGCIHAWRDERGRARSENPCTTYSRLGLSRAASTITTLAAVHSVREPFNPLGGDASVLRRIIIAALQELMIIREHELAEPEFIEYQGGIRAFALARWTLPLSLVAQDLPEDVRAVWIEGLARMVDHESISQVGMNCNQWSFIVRAIQQYRECVDDPYYESVVRRHVRWMLTRTQGGWGQMPAGYFAESGPDATYIGITLHNLGYVFERTRDAELLAALRRCLALFNHTVAPEPDGSWMGATNFCPRTPDDWSKPQFGAGIGMLADDAEEAAPLVGRAWMSPPPAGNAVELRAAEQATAGLLRPLPRTAFDNPGEQVLLDAADIAFLVWRHYASTPLRANLPALSPEPFTRTFGDEFMCVRRPSYYAFLSSGGPMEDWQKRQRPMDAGKQFPRNGGGLCMFWTPAFGSSILAKNWSAFTANTVLALRPDGGADWEDYWSVTPEFDVAAAEARVRSALLQTAVKIDRRVTFLDDAVRCELLLDVAADVEAGALRECIPYPTDKPRSLQVSLLDESGQPVADRPAAAVQFSNGSGEVHLLIFDEPRPCEVGINDTTDNYGKVRRHGRILAEFAPPVSGRIIARWLVQSAPAAQVPLTIRAAKRRLQAE